MDAIITTVSGRKIPIDKSPDPDLISIKDIAQGLSMQCRYNGQLKSFYNVADHSLAVSRAVFLMTDSYEAALEGLLHDAHEAYVGDMAYPIKQFFKDKGSHAFDFLEHYVAGSIMLKYGLPQVVRKTTVGWLYLPSDKVVEADHKAFEHEVYWLERAGQAQLGRNYKDLFAPVSPSSISRSREEFLKEFQTLRGKIK